MQFFIVELPLFTADLQFFGKAVEDMGWEWGSYQLGMIGWTVMERKKLEKLDFR